MRRSPRSPRSCDHRPRVPARREPEGSAPLAPSFVKRPFPRPSRPPTYASSHARRMLGPTVGSIARPLQTRKQRQDHRAPGELFQRPIMCLLKQLIQPVRQMSTAESASGALGAQPRYRRTGEPEIRTPRQPSGRSQRLRPVSSAYAHGCRSGGSTPIAARHAHTCSPWTLTWCSACITTTAACVS